MNPIPARTKAFTLIELLVVMGLIVLLLGGIGLANRGGSGQQLDAAQRTVASLLQATRGQAILHQTEARLLVAAENPSVATKRPKKLSFFLIVRQNDEGGWVPVNSGHHLGNRVFFVPENNGDNAPLFAHWNGVARYSNVSSEELMVEGYEHLESWYSFAYNSAGVLQNAPPDLEIILGEGRRQSAREIVFADERSTRGIILRRVGTYSLFRPVE
ncbi:MAG: type II secretion system GspH family protein [Opitutales bacterium]|nr:type II secretion system GspH family protein [Opitutales bacterium]